MAVQMQCDGNGRPQTKGTMTANQW